jgi:hypothetical protein
VKAGFFRQSAHLCRAELNAETHGNQNFAHISAPVRFWAYVDWNIFVHLSESYTWQVEVSLAATISDRNREAGENCHKKIITLMIHN